jgi:hypothetical protein
MMRHPLDDGSQIVKLFLEYGSERAVPVPVDARSGFKLGMDSVIFRSERGT